MFVKFRNGTFSVLDLTMTVERTNRSGIKQTGSIHLSNAIDSSIDTDDVPKLTQGGSEDEMPPLSIKTKRRRSAPLMT